MAIKTKSSTLKSKPLAKVSKSKSTKPKSRSKNDKKSQKLKDQAIQKDLDNMMSTSSIFSEIQANRPEVKKMEMEKKAQTKKETIKSTNKDLLVQLESISNFSL